jgi:hypothetical protein
MVHGIYSLWEEEAIDKISVDVAWRWVNILITYIGGDMNHSFSCDFQRKTEGYVKSYECQVTIGLSLHCVS